MRNSLLTLLIASMVLGCTDKDAKQNITFAPKAFYDSGKAFENVYMAGTLTGPGVAYENNSTVVACYKDRMECLTYSIEQIGPNQVGRLDAPVFYPVTKWNESEIVATDAGEAIGCRKDTITISRKSESALWVVEPINQTHPECKNATNSVLKWTIEDSPGWKALSKK